MRPDAFSGGQQVGKLQEREASSKLPLGLADQAKLAVRSRVKRVEGRGPAQRRFGPAPVAEVRQHVAEPAMIRGILRLQTDGLLQLGARFLHVTEAGQEPAEVAAGVGVTL